MTDEPKVVNPFGIPSVTPGQPEWTTTTEQPTLPFLQLAELDEKAATDAEARKREADKRAVARDKKKAECLEKIQGILLDHNGQESNIGIGHEYWGILARYRALNAI